MRNSLIFFTLLICSSIIELSAINTLSYPFNLFPLTFIIGVLMMQMLPIALGTLWFVALPLVLSALGPNPMNIFPYLIVAIAGAALTLRVLTRRSIYALFGLGIILTLLFWLSNAALGISLFGAEPVLKSIIILISELLIGLFLCFLTVQKLRPKTSLFSSLQKS